MTRILFVGNFAQKIPGGFYYNVDHKIQNGLIRSGYCVLTFSDRDQARLSNIFGNRKLGVSGANKKFLSTVDNFQPDMILLGHANIIRNESLTAARKLVAGLRIGMFNVDSLAFDGHTDNVKHLLHRADCVDALFITTGGDLLKQFVRHNNIVGYIPNPVDPSIEILKNYASADLPVDMIFCVGGIENETDQRYIIANRLRAGLPDVRLKFHGLFGAPPAFGMKYIQALAQSKMGLNFSRPNDAYLYASDRMAHLLGNGLLTLTPAASGFQKFFSDQEMAFYKDEEDLIRVIRIFKGDDALRRAVAKAGAIRSHKYFTGDLVAKYMVEQCLNQKPSQDYLWQDEILGA